VLRVLVCEDSPAYASALRRVLEQDNDITVPTVCYTAEEAIAALPRVAPDLVTMDVELPGMNGLAAVGEIMNHRPLPILVLYASAASGTNQASAALAAGALEAIAKDDLDLRDPADRAGAELRHRVRVLSQAQVIRHPFPKHSLTGPTDLARPASVIGVCASVGGPQLLMFLLRTLPADYPIPLLIVQHMAAGFTEGLVRLLNDTAALPVRLATGGPQLLMFLLRTLPADYPIPLLIVQHMAAGFTEGLVRLLNDTAALPVRLATGGPRAGPGAWIAPDGAHLTLAGAGHLALDTRTVSGPHRPSGDVLLDSIAATAGPSGVAVVLSGMGQDGAAGAAAVRRAGGLAIAQDEHSSAVFGMPKAAIDLGVDVVLSPREISACLLELRRVPLPGDR
jgi:two-component system, chemotaxis family, protein-glutamate methylesterase/glutaminase